MITEAVLYLASIGLLGALVGPVLRNRQAPDWLMRLRLRGRPGTLTLVWIGALAGFLLPWIVGDQHGLLALLAWLLHPGLPLAALVLTRWWRTAPV